MNTKNSTYGSITKNRSDKYQVSFYNPITKEVIWIGTFHKEDAEIEFQKANFVFFSENSWLLPKSISLNRKEMLFVFTITIRGKTIFIFHSPDLNEVVRKRDSFALNIISTCNQQF